jgi:hypothetical protein
LLVWLVYLTILVTARGIVRKALKRGVPVSAPAGW